MEAGRWSDYLTPRAAVGSQEPPTEKKSLGSPYLPLDRERSARTGYNGLLDNLF